MSQAPQKLSERAGRRSIGDWLRWVLAAALVSATWGAAGGTALAAGPPKPDPGHEPVLCATEPAPAPPGSPVTPAPILSGPEVWAFESEPRLRPMRVTVTADHPDTARGEIFVAPYNLEQVTGQTGSLILDDAGDPVWFRPLPSPDLQNADFKVQTYHDPRTGKSEPVLTWWQGTIAIPPRYANLPGGAPEPGGCWYIVDSSYRLLQTVFAHHGYFPDEHEFQLTERGTALFLATKPVPMDLRPYGGPADGAILNSEIQEVDLATGELVFAWNLLDHVDPSDSLIPASDAVTSGGVWDAYHPNSIDQGPDGQLLISMRNMWAVYAISRQTGEIEWQLGGERSDFALEPGAEFFWQHDARYRPGDRISMFDDGCCADPESPPEQESHGLILELDFDTYHATAVRTYFHEPPLVSASQGNLQALPNGNEFVGWGQSPYYSEYAEPGNAQGQGERNLRYDAEMPGSNISYRAFRQEWVGTPYYPPSVAVRGGDRHHTVYASWNGSTLTEAWQVLAGSDPDRLSVVVPYAPRSGFETAVPVAGSGPYFQVRALDAAGKVIGASEVTTAHR